MRNKEVNEKHNHTELHEAKMICQELYGKEINCKKNILEYIEILGMVKKNNLTEAQLEKSYGFVYQEIEKLRGSVKPNTMMFLKNKLKARIGKYAKNKDPRPINYFIEFFKEAYPANYRRKEYTTVLMDVVKITEEQLWTTLTYINRQCIKSNLKLSDNQKKHIIEVIERAVSKKNIKFINKIKSLKDLIQQLNISIISANNVYKVKVQS